MRRFTKDRSKKRGLPPGTLVPIGTAGGPAGRITLIAYDQAEVLEKGPVSLEECLQQRAKPGTAWINIDGLGDAGLIQAIGEHFGLHPLVLEDILNTDQRPKVEDFGQYLYVVLKMVRWDAAVGEVDIEQVSLILGDRFLLSFQERPGDVFEPIRDRLRGGKGRVRAAGADYLAYCLIDAVVDGYFAALESFGEKIESVENLLLGRPDPTTLHQLHRLKREALLLRKAVWPMREVLSALGRTETPLVGKPIGPYLRDAYDHTVQVIDTMETFRDMLAGMLDTYLSSLSNRMNEVMKVLTIIATVFIPVTFIAGIYGMNFQYMPELQWRGGYFIVLGLMAVLMVGMLLWFRRKRWV